MRYQSSGNEPVRVAQYFVTGQTVSVQVINLATDAFVSLTTGTATESAVFTGLFIWSTADLVTQPTAYTEYVVIFSGDTTGRIKMSKIVLGGHPDTIAALNDLSIADVQTALTNQGYTMVRAALLDNLDKAITATETAILAAVSGQNDIAVSDILTAVLSGSGETVDTALSRLDNTDATLTALDELIRGGRDIDFIGNDALGWQRIERNQAGAEVVRYNLFDEAGARITGTVAAFLGASKMIASEVKL